MTARYIRTPAYQEVSSVSLWLWDAPGPGRSARGVSTDQRIGASWEARRTSNGAISWQPPAAPAAS